MAAPRMPSSKESLADKKDQPSNDGANTFTEYLQNYINLCISKIWLCLCCIVLWLLFIDAAKQGKEEKSKEDTMRDMQSDPAAEMVGWLWPA